MIAIAPVVRHMLLCDDVVEAPAGSGKVNLVGLITSIESRLDPPFPLNHPSLCVYVQMTNGRGRADVQVLIRLVESDRPVSGIRPRAVAFPPEPLPVHAMLFRILECRFPKPGLYQVEFRVGDQVLAQEPLLVR